ncbi:hypothetical protein HBH56_088870 [Parastagonospora nodorum]|uniref:Hypervirulence associated protein TUDOR domain-containing protein n=2 Tax=Phaeosphaeria nodorum (strain SN15 / ATCC MYA-4574 / FGSC 10173) TaxID=321614 RepID=A0A7U2F7Y6_PHANO|nr:hypothetical protein HBH56_088870 [Parastagonospora nodorum]QRC98089.1 hypothetical protein JI435_042010 [Parastagonospora nodorum SN15]KAH3936117.1 hypothetical protein HBH54_023510 [Parastagonospora nodorum]KAH3966282.1 hypothetical protein HBH51_144760 [Parastagonospora nodorum]KAH3989635.1 hypothetical protein HBH52_019750 [Parastagonospora nodorum]
MFRTFLRFRIPSSSVKKNLPRATAIRPQHRSLTCSMPSNTKKDDKYTDPELRDEVKEEIQAGDKGGAPGQWSARKAQMMASEYKKRGGGYTTDENHKDESAKHLDQWTEEEWQTKEGSGNAKDADGTEHRYLPKQAWEQMSEKEKKATDAKKQQGSHEGKQFVSNTSKAKDARKNVSETNGSTKPDDSTVRTDYTSAKNCTEHWEDPNHLEKNMQAYKTFKEKNRKSAEEGENAKKRGQAANGNSPNKKQKSSGQDVPEAPLGSITRVPKQGQKVQWHSIAGYVDGEVVEVVYEDKEVEGKKAKGSKEDPRVVLKGDVSGKIVVHKPEAVYFD